MKNNIVLGIDFGTDSVRALIVHADTGKEISSASHYYTRWAKGKYCVPRNNQFRQHPLDYIESLTIVTKLACKKASQADARFKASDIMALAIDTTGSTPCLTDQYGRPLALRTEFKDDPDAMFILWKDHSAVEEALQINRLAHQEPIDYTQYSGGTYSSEWFWAKALHVLNSNAKIAAVAESIIEHADWMVALLTGCDELTDIKRNRCAAGHKAMWHSSWGGYPPITFWEKLSPQLAHLAEKLPTETYTAETNCGKLCPEWAIKLGLSTETIVAMGALDAHVGAIGAGIKSETLVRIMGTSTCDILIGPQQKNEHIIPGICGQVDGSVLNGYIGYEAGQSAYGDIFAWFRDLLIWPLRNIPGITISSDDLALFTSKLLPALESAAENVKPHESSVLALDWFNGRRTPHANQKLKSAITGLHLGSDAAMIYRALVEGAAFGARAILDSMRAEGLCIKEVIAIGGVAKKSPLAMQILADVLGMPISVTCNEQVVALGATMLAATAAGLHPNIHSAQIAMQDKIDKCYKPNPNIQQNYHELYEKYKSLGKFAEDN